MTTDQDGATRPGYREWFDALSQVEEFAGMDIRRLATYVATNPPPDERRAWLRAFIAEYCEGDDDGA